MKRTIMGVVAGLVAWVTIGVIAGLIMRATWPEYVAVSEAMTFTLPMQIVRLAIGAVASLGAGWIIALIARHSAYATLVAGAILLVVFVPQHVYLWDKFPLWYHLTFLLTLVPLCSLGGKLVGPTADPVKAAVKHHQK